MSKEKNSIVQIQNKKIENKILEKFKIRIKISIHILLISNSLISV